ncbi:uncharacterized protein LOC108605762 [Drosophila busckii]|uniref:uncharacterized protein LOC108605762 n=1 Tax=Drosophila busckii TaxID=30019 RepID=UPI00083EE480|nr:uncharacterized protein LOC108605762 [Drosophila busckii]
MCLCYKLADALDIYTAQFELHIEPDTNLLPRAAQKATELQVRGYITHTHCGQLARGELEGSLQAVQEMLCWLQQEASQQPQFGNCQRQFKPKYDHFFYC